MNKQMINLTVFCSSKNNLKPIYYEKVIELIELLDPTKISLVYGGGTNGLMGTIRTNWLKKSGKIITANMHKFAEECVPDDYLFDTIDDRQKKLVELGDGYLILPGGYGTHFEALEVMTKNDIGECSKPIFIYNVDGIFDDLIIHINKLINEGFITRDFKKIKVYICSKPEELAELIKNL
jgi:uncharacterized protein (TIGR00730 family)